MKKIIILIYCFIIGCSSGNKNLEETNLASQKENIVYTVDPKNIKVIWGGFKTTSKIKVVGFFENFSFDKEGQEFESIKELLNELNFEVFTNSSYSGDQIRDSNLKNNFFKLLDKNLSIKGTFGEPKQDSILTTFHIFPKDQKIRLGYSYKDQLLEIKGKINMATQLGSSIAFNTIHKLCYELHKGDDGISKTWEEVEIHIKVPIITKTRE